MGVYGAVNPVVFVIFFFVKELRTRLGGGSGFVNMDSWVAGGYDIKTGRRGVRVS